MKRVEEKVYLFSWAVCNSVCDSVNDFVKYSVCLFVRESLLNPIRNSERYTIEDNVK